MTYVYRCASCGRDFDYTFAMGAADKTAVCPWPQCEGRGIRVIGAPAVKVEGGTGAGYVKR